MKIVLVNALKSLTYSKGYDINPHKDISTCGKMEESNTQGQKYRNNGLSCSFSYGCVLMSSVFLSFQPSYIKIK